MKLRRQLEYARLTHRDGELPYDVKSALRPALLEYGVTTRNPRCRERAQALLAYTERSSTFDFSVALCDMLHELDHE